MDWKKLIPQGLKDTKTELYFNCVENRPVSVDCGLGYSPIGAPEKVKSAFGPLFGDDLSRYIPPSERLARPVRDFWGGLVDEEELVFANGTDTILVVLAKALAAPGGKVLGMAPQFTDGPVHFQLSGCDFLPLPLGAPEYRIEVNDLLKALDDSISLVYVDRPHNPTGQLMDLKDLDRLISAANDVGAMVIVDEAYGDFVPEETSCLNLSRKNLICLRTFSKGWGMAGVRGGYGVFRDPYARELYLRVSPPFTVDALGFSSIPMALEEGKKFLPSMRTEIAKLKDQVIKEIESTSGFSVAHTCMSVAIMMVTYDGPINLYDSLMDQGIKTAPGSGFLGIGDNSVRLRVPPEEQMEEFIARWRAMARGLRG
ncbi:pyridoxal phosphate-dependent aminotransferase [Dethiosulfovibrio salsuginis]|uniref:histidinol-phosphate transaminase n=1 Tax=Dethiosulfovibrio salsuginis TaxID=561720 RepID=A0A1X7KGH6_9BACT|nr:aminotransferase class I/II-fold pyridoxal phosphate-dependent enzyme [Dethiosulfovibrio salsuginis]SMG39612.1 histidinol-phosphate aminotransferase [Dethiosulfovibrio salsuginis]